MNDDRPLEHLDFSDELDTLATLVESTDSSVIVFALYQSVLEKQTVIRLLRDRLPLPVAERSLSKNRRDPLSLLKSLPLEPRYCVCIDGVEDALPVAAGILALQREAFLEFPHAMVFWVREYGLKEIVAKAPDFWAWRSGVYDFRKELVWKSLPTMQRFHRSKSLVELENRAQLYRNLIQEYESQANPSKPALATLQSRLGSALFDLGYFVEAETWFRKSLHLVRQQGDRSREGRILSDLGVLYDMQGNWTEAEAAYQASLTISKDLGDRLGEGIALANLARLCAMRDDLQEALTFGRQAVSILETTEAFELLNSVRKLNSEWERSSE